MRVWIGIRPNVKSEKKESDSQKTDRIRQYFLYLSLVNSEVRSEVIRKI